MAAPGVNFEELMEQADKARVTELEGLIKQARHDYYNATAKVKDEVYDAWIDELSELSASNPVVTAIGAKPVSEWLKVAHEIPMGSLDKVNTLDELTTWVLSFSPKGAFEGLIVTEKLDGISIHVRYLKGVFAQAITRGDGVTGEDISNNVCKMNGIPAKLPEKFTGSLRGEIILTKENHTRHFPDYANTRNAASGIAKRYDGKGCEHLDILFYQVAEGKEFEVESQQFEWLAEMGFKTPNWYVTAMAPNVKTPQDLWVEYQQTKRAELAYDIDGLVVRINNLVKQISLGEKDGRPLGAVAFKFGQITRETQFIDIYLSMNGASGVVSPVAMLEPVRLLGTEITRASLYNFKYVRELGLTPGCRVLVARANDVIPRVVSVTVPSSKPLVIPTQCPSCSGALTWEGEYLVCPNSAACPAQAVGRIKRYVKELEILEWGETLIEKLIESGLVKGIPDLYRLKQDDIAGIDRMGEKSAENVLKTLRAKNPIPLDKLLGSLSIPICGTTTITAVMDAGLDTWDKIRVASRADFERVPSLGPVKGSNLHTWVTTLGHKLVPELFEVGVKVKERQKGVLTGLSFCFTGKSERKRADLENLVSENGGTVKASVTKGLTYLVLADPKSSSTKASAARKNGTSCISEGDFIKMVNP
jgi:DNA ligase (NAD+)